MITTENKDFKPSIGFIYQLNRHSQMRGEVEGEGGGGGEEDLKS
jgi:hypothetical protein